MYCRLAEKKQARFNYQTDLAKMEDILNQLEQNIPTTLRQIDERRALLKQYKDKKSQNETAIAQMRQTIATQILSVNDLIRLQSEHKSIEEDRVRRSKSLEKIQDTLRTAEIEFAQHLTGLDQKVDEYNTQLDELATVMESPAWTDAFKAMVNHERARDEKLDVTALLGIDFAKDVDPAVKEQDDKLKNDIQVKQQAHSDKVEERNTLSKEIEALGKDLAMSMGEAETLNKELHQLKAVYTEEQCGLDQQVQAIEQTATKVPENRAWQEQLKAHAEQRETLKVELAQARQQGDHTIQEIQRQIDQAMCLMKDNDAFVETELQTLENYWREKIASLDKLVLKNP